MIKNYSDHAANERTFLAWVRTGIAVMAFGFVIERFNLFLATIARSALSEPSERARLLHLAGGVGRTEGLALIVAGILLIVLASIRFVRTTRLLDDAVTHAAKDVRTELIFTTVLVLLVASYGAYLLIR